MKTNKLIHKALCALLALAVLLPVSGIGASAAGRSDGRMIQMYVCESSPDYVSTHPEVISKISDQLFLHQSMIEFSVSQHVSVKDIPQIFGAVLAIHPELFFVERYFTVYASGAYVTRIYPSYSCTREQAGAQLQKFYNEADRYLGYIRRELDSCSDDFSKALLLHDELVLDARYDLDSISNYSLMVDKAGVCENYARVYAYLLSQCGIYSEIVGSDSMCHEWLMVCLDGEYYHVDPTWDDPYPENPGIVLHDFFLLSEQRISEEVAGGVHEGFATLNKADSTGYDSALFHNYTSRMCRLSPGDKTFYGIGSAGIERYNYETDTAQLVLAMSPDWDLQGADDLMPRLLSGLEVYNGLLYYNTPTAVYTFDPNNGETRQVYISTDGRQLCGIRMHARKMYGIFSDDPSESFEQKFIFTMPGVQWDELTVDASIAKTTILQYDNLNITGKASGGTGVYTYALMIRPLGSSEPWKPANVTFPVNVRMNVTGDYLVRVTVTDEEGAAAEKIINVRVNPLPDIVVNASLSALECTSNGCITVSCAPTGGNKSYTYDMSSRMVGETQWKTFSDKSSAMFAQSQPGEYEVRITVTDGVGNTAEEIFRVRVAAAALSNYIKPISGIVNLGEKVIINGSVGGGYGNNTYAFWFKRSAAKNWVAINETFTKANGVSFTPKSAGTYNIKTLVTDGSGQSAERLSTVLVVEEELHDLENTSYVSAVSSVPGERVTLYGQANQPGVKYSFYYKRSTSQRWTLLGTEYGSADKMGFTPKTPGEFDVRIDARSYRGQVQSRYLAFSVGYDYAENTLQNTSTVSTQELSAGERLIVNASAGSGTAPYTYAVYYKRIGAVNWTTLSDFSATAACGVRLKNAGDYLFKISVRDSVGNTASKNYAVRVG